MASKHLQIGAISAVMAVVFTLGAKAFQIPAWLLTVLTISGGIIAARLYYKQQLAKAKNQIGA